MPTNPVPPTASAATERLNLGIESPRGAEPSFPPGPGFAPCGCFDAEASALLCEGQWQSTCFEAE